MTTSIKIVGLAELQKKLGADFKRPLRGATLAIAQAIQHELTPYPPTTEANRPGGPGSRWYERGYGPKRETMAGVITGRKTSEVLFKSWGIERRGIIGQVLGSKASYSPYVHSEEKQAKFHGKRGWVTDEDAVKKVERDGTIERIVSQAVMHALGQK